MGGWGSWCAAVRTLATRGLTQGGCCRLVAVAATQAGLGAAGRRIFFCAGTNAPPAAPAGEQPNAQPNAKCNVSACAAAYHTFTESDCTFMATGGMRKLCTK